MRDASRPHWDRHASPRDPVHGWRGLALPDRTTPPLVDIHCHILPGMDDGAATWAEALAMAEVAYVDGIRTIVATPHQLGAYAGNRGETIRQRAAELAERLGQRGPVLEVLPGAEVRVTADLVAQIRRGEVLTLADRGRHVLLELPHDAGIPLEGLLGELRQEGLVGILSHPERNVAIMRHPEEMLGLVAAGCLIQIAAGSLCGRFGSRVQAFCHWVVRRGLVHFVASDAHSVHGRAPRLRQAFQRIEALAGRAMAMACCSENPARVVQGQEVSPVVRRRVRSFWPAWMSWRKAS